MPIPPLRQRNARRTLAKGQCAPDAVATNAPPELWITPAGIDQLVVHGGNTAVITLPLPNAPQLAGLHLHAQALVLDAAAVAGLAGVSNAGGCDAVLR